MKKFLCIALITSFFAALYGEAVQAQGPGGLYTGKDNDGNYVIPASLAVECKVSVSSSDAGVTLRECIERMIKDRSGKAEDSERVQGIWKAAINEGELGSLVETLKIKVYAADYDKDVLEDFTNNMSGEKSAMLGSGSSGGGGEAATGREDWMNVGKSDDHIATYVNGQLNNFMATVIMRKALRAFNGMDGSYFAQ